jgi:hypothetical protein
VVGQPPARHVPHRLYARGAQRSFCPGFFLLALTLWPQPALPDADRALYAALAPSPETSGVLRRACRTWEDHAWVSVSVACEARLSAALARAGLGAWDAGDDDDALGPPGPTFNADEGAAEAAENAAEVAALFDFLNGLKPDEGCATQPGMGVYARRG